MHVETQTSNTSSRLFDNKPRRGELDLPKAELAIDGRLVFLSARDLKSAHGLGAFRLKIPEGLDLSFGLKLAEEFTENAEPSQSKKGYMGYRSLEKLYFHRKAYHMEQLIISREDRKQYFPPPLMMMINQLDEISTAVLCSTLETCEIPIEHWDTASGGAAYNSGTHWFVCNKYRPANSGLSGCSAHQDTGFVTILYIEADGLEAFVDGAWCRIAPEPGYLLVNFGLGLSMLTKLKKHPVTAMLHRVFLDDKAFMRPQRVSFAAFSSAPTGGHYFQSNLDGSLRKLYDVNNFLIEHDKKTWAEDA